MSERRGQRMAPGHVPPKPAPHPTPPGDAERPARPTANEILVKYSGYGVAILREQLDRHGYLIVHFEDVERQDQDGRGVDLDWAAGWNDCIDNLFETY